MKTSIKIGLLVLVGMFSACSDKETDNKIIDATKDIKFKVDFADYNAEQEFDVTRATGSNGKLNQQVVNLGNGILALCTLQHDTTQQNKSIATRVLPNDTYTMLAYDHTTHAFKGEMTGTIVGGAFAASGGKKSISLPPATYDFVLFNSKVTRSGNQLSVARSNIAGALIGRTTQTLTATPEYQSVSFTLKHVGAKVRMKITGYRQFTNAKATLSSSAVPGTIVYEECKPQEATRQCLRASPLVQGPTTPANTLAIVDRKHLSYQVRMWQVLYSSSQVEVSILKIWATLLLLVCILFQQSLYSRMELMC